MADPNTQAQAQASLDRDAEFQAALRAWQQAQSRGQRIPDAATMQAFARAQAQVPPGYMLTAQGRVVPTAGPVQASDVRGGMTPIGGGVNIVGGSRPGGSLGAPRTFGNTAVPSGPIATEGGNTFFPPPSGTIFGGGFSVPLGGNQPEPTNGDDATTGGGKMSNVLKSLLTPQALTGLAALVAGLTSRAGQRGAEESSEEIQRINAITEAQMRRADPLHQVAVNLAFGRMPTQYRQGVNLTNVPLPR